MIQKTTLKVGIEAGGLLRRYETGIQRYTTALVTILANCAEAEGIHLYLYFPRRPPSSAIEASQTLSNLQPGRSITWRTAPFARGWQRVGMGIAMRLDGLDVFHFPAPLMARYCPVPSVVTFHDLAALSLSGQETLKEAGYLSDALDAGRRATTLLADSESTREEIARHLNRTDATVVYAGVDTSRFFPASPDAVTAIRQNLGLDRYILCVGTLQTRKNHLRLIQAFEQIQGQIPHTLVLVGRDGSGAEAIRSYVLEHPDSRIRLIGYLDDALLSALYTGADVVALPSLWEGFGLPIVEAMACGTPVLTSNVSSLAEVAGEAALLVSPTDVQDVADKLLRLLTDNGLRERLRNAGFRRAAEFSWESSADRLVAVYRQTARQGKGRR